MDHDSGEFGSVDSAEPLSLLEAFLRDRRQLQFQLDFLRSQVAELHQSVKDLRKLVLFLAELALPKGPSEEEPNFLNTLD